MARAKTRSKRGEAISPERRTPAALKQLRAFLRDAKAMAEWRRACAVLAYINGKRVLDLVDTLGAARGSINQWLLWYDADGVDGLRSRKPPGAAHKLDERQLSMLAAMVEAGPQAAGFSSGIWTGPMIGELIRRQFGVRYHNHHVPRLLHYLGFSVQRPRKRLAKADLAAQERWVKKRLPAIKKKRRAFEELSSSSTRRASGSTARFTKRGRASASSLA